MLSNHQNVVGHMPPGPNYGDTPVLNFNCLTMKFHNCHHTNQHSFLHFPGVFLTPIDWCFIIFFQAKESYPYPSIFLELILLWRRHVLKDSHNSRLLLLLGIIHKKGHISFHNVLTTLSPPVSPVKPENLLNFPSFNPLTSPSKETFFYE